MDFLGSLNYLPATRLGSLTIKRAVPTVTVTGSVNVYDGLPHAASAFVTGVGGEELGSATVQYDGNIAVPVDAGTYDASASYERSRNYDSAVGSAALVDHARDRHARRHWRPVRLRRTVAPRRGNGHGRAR